MVKKSKNERSRKYTKSSPQPSYLPAKMLHKDWESILSCFCRDDRRMFMIGGISIVCPFLVYLPTLVIRQFVFTVFCLSTPRQFMSTGGTYIVRNNDQTFKKTESTRIFNSISQFTHFILLFYLLSPAIYGGVRFPSIMVNRI